MESKSKQALTNLLESYLEGKEPDLNYQERERKPIGYWNNIETIKKEIKLVIKKHELNEFPSKKVLTELGYSSLASAIHKNGGFPNFRKSMGFSLVHREMGYWQKWENIEKELRKIIDNLGHFPSHSELDKLSLSSLSGAINNFGGVNNVRTKMGYEKIESKIERFKDFKIVKKTLSALIEEVGHFPSAEEIRKKDLGVIVDAVYKYHKGLEKVREKMGYDSANIDNRKYATEKKLLKGLNKLWERYPKKKGTIPPENWMRKNGFSILGHSIVKYHNGFIKLRKKLNIRQLRMADEVDLKNWNVLIFKIDEIYDKHPEFNRTLPSSSWLANNGHFGIENAIRKYHGGFTKAREKLGQEVIKVDDGYFKAWSNLKKELEKITKTNNGKFPSSSWLSKNGYSYLNPHIIKFHGGMNEVRKKLGKNIIKVKNGYWKDWKNVEAELIPIIDGYGYLPGTWTLNKIRKKSLAMAIHKYHGGMMGVRERMKEYLDSKSRNQNIPLQNENLEVLLENYVGGEDG